MEAAADLGLRMGVEGGRETLSVLQQLQASIDRLTGSVDRLEARMARTRGTERMDQGARRATTSLNAMATSVDRAGRSIGVLHQHQDRYISAQARSAAVFGTQIGLLRQLQISLVSVAAALSVRAVVNYADAWQYANNRLRLATNGAAELKRAQTDLFAVSQRTFSSFRSSAETLRAIRTIDAQPRTCAGYAHQADGDDAKGCCAFGHDDRLGGSRSLSVRPGARDQLQERRSGDGVGDGADSASRGGHRLRPRARH